MLVARQNSKPHKPLHKLHLTNFTSQTSLHKPQKPHFASLCEKKCTFRPQPSKFFPEKFLPFSPKKPTIKKCLIFSQIKIFLHFGKWNFLEIEFSSYIFSKKLFLYFKKWKFSKKLIIFQEGTFGARKIKKTHSENFLAPILKNFYTFPKNKNLIFQEGTCKVWKTNISCIFGNGPF